MSKLIQDRISENLERLRLNRIQEVFPDILKKTEESQESYMSFLDQILAEEVGVREDRRLRTALRTAGLPFEKTIEEYDFSFHPDLDKQSVMRLFDLDFITAKENVIFLGPPGVGKSHLAVSLAVKAAHFGFTIYFTTMVELITKLKIDADLGRFGRGRSYYKSSLVIVDEVGYMPISRQEAHLFFQFISYRYEKSSTIITSNKSFSEWNELFDDPVIATAILDRLLHHCQVIGIKGNSYRLKHFKEQNKQSKEVPT